MPNWCENRVDLYCDDEEALKNFVEAFMPKGYFDFHALVPLGFGMNDDGNPAWDYNTAVNKWGTKWQLCDDDRDSFDIRENSIHASFDTAWAPPEGIYHAIDDWFNENARQDSHSISWFYDEPGMQFAGYLNNE